jgi:uncharacterized protein (DUF433 family)
MLAAARVLRIMGQVSGQETMSYVDTSRNGAAQPEDPYVAEYPGVCGGHPVIRETRIPVRLVVQYSQDGATIDELADVWPTVTAEQIAGALDYYARHRDRVDEDLERHAQEILFS